MNDDKYKGIYRIPSARWRDWDCDANAAYFVTICTAHRIHYFGAIADGGVKTPKLGVIINQYKRACTLYARMNAIPFAWQTRFHDRVIRNYDELARIEKYIDANISNWHDDELYNF
jgi:hypothetical protein